MNEDNIINKFLNEDMLITKPSMYIYISKDKVNNVVKNGIQLSDNRVSAYLSRLPETNGEYEDFLDNNYPVQITFNRLKKIKDQNIKLIPVNIDIDPKEKITEDILRNLKKKYSSYLNICYNDHIPLKDIPHIDIIFSKSFIPGFICKVLKNNSYEVAQ